MSFHGHDRTMRRGVLPPVFHFIWLSDDPEKQQPPVDVSKSWSHYHPKHRVIHWRKGAVRHLIQRFFPKLLPIFDGTSVCPWLESIVARIAILAALGGVYIDYDLEACGHLGRLAYPSATCILLANTKPLWGESRIRRGIMATIPNHPFFLEAVKTLETFPFPKSKNGNKNDKTKDIKINEITSYRSKSAHKLREILEPVFEKHKDKVTLVSDAILVPYGAMVPMHKQVIGIYRAPKAHHWEKWYHKAYRKYHCFCKDNPFAGRLITYFIMGLITGLVLNLIVILIRNAVNSKRRAKGKHPV